MMLSSVPGLGTTVTVPATGPDGFESANGRRERGQRRRAPNSQRLARDLVTVRHT